MSARLPFQVPRSGDSAPDSNGAVTDLVTVVVPARNEEEAIGPCLDSILAQDEPNLQVVVVDGASTDRTADVVREYMSRDPRVELLVNPDAIIPKSLNLALAQARGRWLVRIDAHATIPRGYVRQVTDRLRSGQWAGVGGRKDGVGVTPAGRAIAAAMASPFGVGNSTYHYGTSRRTVDHIPFGAYPTALARELGGWDERCVVNQDFEFDYRLRRVGFELLFDPDLSISWESRQSIPALWRQYRRYGRGKSFVARLHPESVELRHLAAPALVAAIAAIAATAVRKPLAGLALLPYAAGVGVASAIASRDVEDRTARRFLPAAFATMHIAWGIGFWEGVLGMAKDAVRRRRGR
jgi:cellulose synthase/poly-beta-1,6-N-acetylglucosamine synthase-like glycosyltransferase